MVFVVPVPVIVTMYSPAGVLVLLLPHPAQAVTTMVAISMLSGLVERRTRPLRRGMVLSRPTHITHARPAAGFRGSKSPALPTTCPEVVLTVRAKAALWEVEDKTTPPGLAKEQVGEGPF